MPYLKNKMNSLIDTTLYKLENKIYTVVSDLEITAYLSKEPIKYAERTSGIKSSFNVNDKWGDLFDCAWFNFEGVVPASCEGKRVVLIIDVSGELCVFDDTGVPIQGLTNIESEANKHWIGGKRIVQVTDKSSGNENINIWADAGCNNLFGVLKNNGCITAAWIAVENESIKELYYDFRFLINFNKSYVKDTARYNNILFALYEACLKLKDYTEQEVAAAKKIIHPSLDKKGGDPSLTITAIGHAHIDLAWLWPIRETKRKGARTFSTVLKNMEKYPDYIFGASQPQLYQWMKEDYPELYKKIGDKIAEGRWECQGGMWVEADTNITGAESLIRQFLYGKQFFKQEFGKDMEILWLPDVFGYTASLPQILKKCGIKYFMTIKLSWSEHNRFPHHTFIWKGIDGSEVLAHMPPEGDYNSKCDPKAILKTEMEFIDKGVSDCALLLYGIGDGGGGPGEEHLESVKRAKNFSGLSPVKQEHSIDFFKRIEKDSAKYKKYSGELYLEKHQGTYTTQARNKYYNRKMEIALRELEIWSCAFLSEKAYSRNEITEIWKEVLLYQFHDILPGSSIKRVYDESVERYKTLLKRVRHITKSILTEFAKSVNTHHIGDPYLLTNSLSWERDAWVKINDKWIIANIMSMGFKVIDASIETKIDMKFSVFAGDSFIENAVIRVEFAPDGSISSVRDKETGREIIKEGTYGNKLTIYPDEGDAWDFDPSYDLYEREYFTLCESEAIIDGPKASIKQIYKYNESTIEQEISLMADSKRIDFKTRADWQEKNKMLRTDFDVDILSDEVTCDIQFGNIKRPTHKNTLWDTARYEICAHKWIDISQRDYGVALLNDSKYGHKADGNLLDIHLLRSTSTPGVEADLGEHEFTYALYPHFGDYEVGGVIYEAYELNIPVQLLKMEKHSGEYSAIGSFIAVEPYNIIVETVKFAENNSDIIVRMYESTGRQTLATIVVEAEDAYLTDMLEERIESTAFDKNNLMLKFEPFEVHTLRLKVL